MKRKLFTIIMTFTLVFTSTNIAFADVKSDVTQNQEKIGINPIEKIISNENVDKDIIVKKDVFQVNGETLTSSMPKEGGDEIEMQVNDDTIKVGLPDMVKEQAGVMTRNGVIVYAGEEKNLTVSIQQEEYDSGDVLRALITIKDASAPKNYTFSYDLPENYQIITMADFLNHNVENLNKPIYNYAGTLVIISDTNDPIMVIEAPWAKDKNMNNVETYYTVSGNQITQTVKFDETSAFPIIADPGHGTASTYTVKLNDSSTLTPWLYPEGQASDGVYLQDGCSIFYSPDGGGTISIALSVGSTYGPIAYSVSVGYTGGTGGGIGYSGQAKKSGKYKLRAKKEISYTIFSQMMKWTESGKTHTMEYGRITKNEKEKVARVELEAM